MSRLTIDSRLPVFNQMLQARLDEHDVEVLHLDVYASAIYKDPKSSSLVFTSPNLEKLSIKDVA